MNVEIKKDCPEIEGPEIMPLYIDDDAAYAAAMQYFADNDDAQGE